LLAVGSFAGPLDQAGLGGIEQQLRTQYALTKVADSGNVTQPGATLVVRFFGIKANPLSGDIYWPNSYKSGGRIGHPMFVAKRGVSKVAEDTRFLRAGENVYVTNIEAKDDEVVFSLQTCDSGFAANEPNGPPYRASVAFQFQKRFVNPSNLKQIQGTVAELLAMAPPDTKPAASSAQGGPVPPPPRLGSLYISAKDTADRLQINTDGSFSLQEGGQSFNGAYAVSGATLKLHIVQLQKDVDIEIQGDRLIVNGDEAWNQPGR
jgi:hypothetical protein